MRLNTAEFIVIYIHTYIYIYIIYKKSVPIVYFIIVSIIIMIISSILLLIITYLTKLLSRFDLPDLPKDSMLRLSPIKTKTKKRRSEQKSQKNKIKNHFQPLRAPTTATACEITSLHTVTTGAAAASGAGGEPRAQGRLVSPGRTR